MENQDINFKETMRELLAQPAKDANGLQIQRGGRDINWMEALCDQLIKKGFKDGSLGWKILQEAGVVSRTTKEQPQQSAEEYEEKLKKKKSEIKRLLKKSGTEDPALDLQIELAARDWIAYEKACMDYTRSQGNEEDRMKLSDQMRKWSATVRDDLTKLTMNVKDAERDQSSEGDTVMDFYQR